MFSKKQVQADEIIKFGDTPIKWENKIKYLGITIDKNLNFSSHVQNIVTKTKGAKFSLFPLLNVRSALSINSKLFIFKTYIRPIITYAGPAWTANISIEPVKTRGTSINHPMLNHRVRLVRLKRHYQSISKNPDT